MLNYIFLVTEDIYVPRRGIFDLFQVISRQQYVIISIFDCKTSFLNGQTWCQMNGMIAKQSRINSGSIMVVKQTPWFHHDVSCKNLCEIAKHPERLFKNTFLAYFLKDVLVYRRKIRNKHRLFTDYKLASRRENGEKHMDKRACNAQTAARVRSLFVELS